VPADQPGARSVAVITMGCARNEVDSEELAAALDEDGWQVANSAADADIVVVNTCGFIEQAKRDSIEAILDAAGAGVPVVAAGCLAERYGKDLAAELPEATVLSFDDYPEISQRVADALSGVAHQPHQPRDRRSLLPITPAERTDVGVPGHQSAAQRLLNPGVSVPVKLASGCDRRCTFCAIPQFRGAFVSRRPNDVLAEVATLARAGTREVVLVSENSTSYGKDLGDIRLLESLLPDLGSVLGIEWVRVSYLQPAEMRPGLVSVIGDTPGIASYFDLSFQHASGSVLRRMRRFGDAESFVELLSRIREVAPHAGIRSNFIVGFPGETDSDIAQLVEFLQLAELDAIGVFGYSDEDGTEAVTLPDHVPTEIVAERVRQVHDLADALMEQRAESRIGERTRMLIETVVEDGAEGRCEHQGPEDATTWLPTPECALNVGEVHDVELINTDGIDLVARLL
jgi:ribosomal protein S12 methylthiotransferase